MTHNCRRRRRCHPQRCWHSFQCQFSGRIFMVSTAAVSVGGVNCHSLLCNQLRARLKFHPTFRGCVSILLQLTDPLRHPLPLLPQQQRKRLLLKRQPSPYDRLMIVKKIPAYDLILLFLVPQHPKFQPWLRRTRPQSTQCELPVVCHFWAR